MLWGKHRPPRRRDDPIICLRNGGQPGRSRSSGMSGAAERGGDASSSSSSSSTPRRRPAPCLPRRPRPRPLKAARPPSSRRTAGRRCGVGVGGVVISNKNTFPFQVWRRALMFPARAVRAGCSRPTNIHLLFVLHTNPSVSRFGTRKILYC